WYFGVPLSNFAGWFLVAFAILGAFRLTDRLAGVPRHLDTVKLGVALFAAVFLFNLGITLYLRQYLLAAASAIWGLVLLLLARKGKRPPLEFRDAKLRQFQ